MFKIFNKLTETRVMEIFEPKIMLIITAMGAELIFCRNKRTIFLFKNWFILSYCLYSN